MTRTAQPPPSDPRPVYKPGRRDDGAILWTSSYGRGFLTAADVMKIERITRAWGVFLAAEYRYYLEEK